MVWHRRDFNSNTEWVGVAVRCCCPTFAYGQRCEPPEAHDRHDCVDGGGYVNSPRSWHRLAIDRPFGADAMVERNSCGTSQATDRTRGGRVLLLGFRAVKKSNVPCRRAAPPGRTIKADQHHSADGAAIRNGKDDGGRPGLREHGGWTECHRFRLAMHLVGSGQAGRVVQPSFQLIPRGCYPGLGHYKDSLVLEQDRIPISVTTVAVVSCASSDFSDVPVRHASEIGALFCFANG
jgi:hypothetical protein